MRKSLRLAANGLWAALVLSLPLTAAGQNAASPGFLKLELFTGIGGTAVSALTSSTKFIENTPDEVRYVAGFGTPTDISNDFGGRLSGLFTPPASGNWIFYVRSDDASELSISSDADPANKAFVAQETACCNPFADARSGTVALTQGVPVYVELLYKEGGGGDYAFVAAKLEEDQTPAAGLPTLSGLSLSTIAPPVDSLSIAQQPASQVGVETKKVAFVVQATVSPAGALVYQWTKDGVDIPGATSTKLTLNNLSTADAGKYAAKVYALGGVNQTSAEAVLTIVPDTFAPVPSLGALKRNGEYEVSVSFDEDVQEAEVQDPANITLTGATVGSSRYVPQAKARIFRLSGALSGAIVSVTVQKVKDVTGNAITSCASQIFMRV